VVASGGDLFSPDSGAFTRRGRLVIADYNALGNGAVFKINVGSGDVKTLASGGAFEGPTDVAIGDGQVFADDPFAGSGGKGAIFEIAGGTATLVSQGGLFAGGPLGLAVLPSGKLLTTDQAAGTGGTGSLLKVNPDNSGVQKFVTQDHKLKGSYGMTLSPSGKVAYVADDENDSIVRVEVATGAQRVVARGTPLDGPTDVALGPDGKLYVVNNGSTHPKVIKINPTTGHTRVFAKDGKLSSPEGITIEPRR
jgi:streptogramin lyase